MVLGDLWKHHEIYIVSIILVTWGIFEFPKSAAGCYISGRIFDWKRCCKHQALGAELVRKAAEGAQIQGVMDESLSLQDIGPVEKLEINSCSSKGSMKSSDILCLLEGGGFKHIAASHSWQVNLGSLCSCRSLLVNPPKWSKKIRAELHNVVKPAGSSLVRLYPAFQHFTAKWEWTIVLAYQTWETMRAVWATPQCLVVPITASVCQWELGMFMSWVVLIHL